jgi:predicted dithiol-disulfide oxidoreductase (DUF899 family)
VWKIRPASDFRVSFRPDEIAAGRAFYNYVNPGLEDLSGDSVFARSALRASGHSPRETTRCTGAFRAAVSFMDLSSDLRHGSGEELSWIRTGRYST